MWRGLITLGARRLNPRSPRPQRGLGSVAFRVIEGIDEFKSFRRGLDTQQVVGLVPTMGALHAGHLSLVQAASMECDVVVGTVFVNPAQFGPNEDFDRYPRSLEADVAGLKDAGVDVVLAPPREAVYRPGHRTYVVPEGIVETTAEAGRRPGFFRGVSTIVCKLFNIVEPHCAYFGQKDGMQCSIVRNMVRDLNMTVDVRICPTVREADGLAMSSRNQYLAPEERARANVVFKGLQRGLACFRDSVAGGAAGAPSAAIREAVRRVYEAEPMVRHVEYISVADCDTFAEIEAAEARRRANLSVAVQVGKVRLIDNLILE